MKMICDKCESLSDEIVSGLCWNCRYLKARKEFELEWEDRYEEETGKALNNLRKKFDA